MIFLFITLRRMMAGVRITNVFEWDKLRPMNQVIYPILISNAFMEPLVCCDINPLTPNDPYRGRTAPLTSKNCILYIYSTNIGIEYFKHGIYSPFFFLFKMQFVS